MTDYAKSTNFAVKDTLTSGDPNKVVSGAEIDTEFNNIASASTTKIDKVPAATTGNIAQFTATGTIEDSGQTVDTIVPAGGIMPYAGATAPSGWLLCGGQEVSRTTYSTLFSTIGTTFGAGDGSSTFNVPDLRDRFPLGDRDQGQSDAGRVSNYNTNLGDTGGEDEHQLTEAEMPSHTHGLDLDSNYERNGGNTSSDFAGTDTQTGSAGGDQPHNNMPPFLALNYIIKT